MEYIAFYRNKRVIFTTDGDAQLEAATLLNAKKSHQVSVYKNDYYTKFLQENNLSRKEYENEIKDIVDVAINENLNDNEIEELINNWIDDRNLVLTDQMEDRINDDIDELLYEE